MGQVSWTAEAERWLKDIHSYIATDNAEAALNTVRGILKKAQLLADFPKLGHRYSRIADRHIRILLFGHYRIAYWVKDDGDIDVLGVFHGALDIERYLF